MSIRLKVSLPVAATVLVLGGLGLWLLASNLRQLESRFVETIVGNKAAEIEAGIQAGADRAKELAALFSRMPAVVGALELAAQGDMRDESDPTSQRAREGLRRELAPMLEGYEQMLGTKFQLHVHMPTTRSLVRLWRKQQVNRDGKWMDVSDDLSSFRQMVLDVNASGRGLGGVELGRGGFAIRGMMPVRSDSGKHLGSVETLVEFGPILATGAARQGEDLLLYMNADMLHISSRLKDPAKYPVLDGRFVLVSGTEEKAVEQLVTADFLEAGRAGRHVEIMGGMALAAFPVKDYKGDQMGVIVYALDTSATEAIIWRTGATIGAILLAILVLPVLVTWFFLSRSVLRPVRAIRNKIRDIAEDRADLSEALDESARDEMGDLASWFNKLLRKLDTILCQTQMYGYMINAVPDPIFAVDDDMNFIVANAATARLGKSTVEALRGTPCRDVFNTELCGTVNCPIEQCRRTGEAYAGNVISADLGGRKVYIQPTSDVLRDCHGKIIGRMEIARDVTPLVEKETTLQSHLEQIRSVNARVAEAAASIAEASGELSGQVAEVSEGAEQQKARAGETAQAMEQMNETVMDVARGASEAAEQADGSRRRAQEGSDVVARAVEAITEVRERSTSLKSNMDALGEKAEGIGQVLNVISDIADQTNLLALNAAIEAARAGDAGRGFAVVADEVRKLAEKTMTATQEVAQAIGAIQTGARENIAAVDQSDKAVAHATEMVNASGAALREISELVTATADRIRSIATAAEEQSATSDAINRAVDEVNAVAQETADGMLRARDNVQRLADLAESLRALSQEM
ncbi:methyl-accepting chemotaxis protein [Desulfocurvus sp.]|uniref:methyl-accepting chemotaxis protein n=1 Tax=Desulfocurvus sp. TaxID=2871698 RepID=UPI0025B7F052|nr:methyl-accepting chemotaxis protein [Desulfocurvus sp.]MCK9239503.1 methyl-accepting chemotaxis protein [Desulfocurvus sp.]